jgi:hypothetical protein
MAIGHRFNLSSLGYLAAKASHRRRVWLIPVLSLLSSSHRHTLTGNRKDFVILGYIFLGMDSSNTRLNQACNTKISF